MAVCTNTQKLFALRLKTRNKTPTSYQGQFTKCSLKKQQCCVDWTLDKSRVPVLWKPAHLVFQGPSNLLGYPFLCWGYNFCPEDTKSCWRGCEAVCRAFPGWRAGLISPVMFLFFPVKDIVWLVWTCDASFVCFYKVNLFSQWFNCVGPYSVHFGRNKSLVKTSLFPFLTHLNAVQWSKIDFLTWL